jgi:halocyanin-like protein
MAGVTGTIVALAGCSTLDGLEGEEVDESDGPLPEGEQAGEDSEVGGGSPREEVDTYLTENNARGWNGEITDRTGQSTTTVAVGAGPEGLVFDPPAFHIDTGTTVIWEWTGEGGGHNVVSSENSDITSIGEEEIIEQGGATVEDTLEDEGVALYHCEPHREQGMIGAIIVGTIEPDNGGATGNETEDGQTGENQTEDGQAGENQTENGQTY